MVTRVSDEGEEERRNEVEGVACGLGSNETTRVEWWCKVGNNVAQAVHTWKSCTMRRRVRQ
jgi:hypothetical protein